MDFSSIRFLKRLESKRIRRLKIAEWLLILLRTLAILFIILAFTRPVINQSEGIFSGESKTAAILILDNSISSGIRTPRGKALSLEISEAIKVLDIFRSVDRVKIISAAKPVVDYTPGTLFGGDERLRRSLFEIPQFDSAPEWREALNIANEFFESSECPNREVYIFSTFLHKANELEDALKSKGNNSRVFLIPVEIENISDLAIVNLQIETQIVQLGKPVSLLAEINNLGKNDLRDVFISCFLEDQRSMNRDFQAPAGVIIKLNLKLVPPSGGLFSGRVVIDYEDQLSTDNIRYFSLNIPEQITAYIAGDSLQSASIARALNPRGSDDYAINVKRIERTDEFHNIPSEAVVIFAGYEDLSSYIANILRRHLDRGGGIIIGPPDIPDIARINRELLKPLGLPQYSEMVEAEQGLEWGRIDLSHSLFSGVFTDEANIHYPKFIRHLSFGGEEGNEIIGMINGHSFLREVDSGKGKVLIFSAGVSEYWGDFRYAAIFAPLFHRATEYLASGLTDLPESVIAGEPVEFVGQQGINSITLVKPDAGKVELNPQNIGGSNVFRYYGTGKSGIYNFSKDGRKLKAVAVNPAVDFASTQTVIEAEGIIFYRQDDGIELAEFVHSARLGRELWNLFLIAGILCLVIEIALAKMAS